jgi:hypothetical protein
VRSNNQTAFSIVRHTHKLNATAYALDAMANLLLLQQCAVFIGVSASSSVFYVVI